MKAFFSVIIPTLNEERALPVLLRALGSQTYRNFEIIVVDGNSEDGTRAAARKAKKVSNISVHKVTVRSVSYQRNYGASRATGAYLIFLDADTVLRPLFLEKVNAVIRRGNYRLILPSMEVDAGGLLQKTVTAASNMFIAVSGRLRITGVPMGACIIERALFEDLGGYKGEELQRNHKLFPEDLDLVSRAKATGVVPFFMWDNRIIVSLRRFRKDGLYRVFSSYLRNMVAMASRKKLQPTPMKGTYEQGGHVYNKQDL